MKRLQRPGDLTLVDFKQWCGEGIRKTEEGVIKIKVIWKGDAESFI